MVRSRIEKRASISLSPLCTTRVVYLTGLRNLISPSSDQLSLAESSGVISIACLRDVRFYRIYLRRAPCADASPEFLPLR